MDERDWKHWYWIVKWREDKENNIHYLDRLWIETKPHCWSYLARKTTMWQRDCHLDMYWGNIHLSFMKMAEKYNPEYGDWLYFMNLALRDSLILTHREYYSHKSALTRGTNVGDDLFLEIPGETKLEDEFVYKDYVYQWINSLSEIDKQIACLRIDGFTLREVADRLAIGSTTVHYHLKKMEGSWNHYDQGDPE